MTRFENSAQLGIHLLLVTVHVGLRGVKHNLRTAILIPDCDGQDWMNPDLGKLAEGLSKTKIPSRAVIAWV